VLKVLPFLNLLFQAILFFSLFPFLFNKIEIGSEKKRIVYYITFSTVVEIYVQTTIWGNLNNIVGTHFYYPLEFLFLFFMLHEWETHYKKLWLISGMIVWSILLIDNFYLTDFSTFPSFSASLQNFYLFLFSARVFLIITTKNFIPFYRDDRFYAAAGIFVYSSLTTLMFLLYKVLNIILPYHVSAVIVIGENALFLTSMIVQYKRQKLLSQV